MDFAILVDQICDKLPRKHWELSSQLRRAANSVHSNIAEGNGRGSIADYLRHLSMSNASLNEAESDLHFVARRFGDRTGAARALQLAVQVRRPLLGLVKKLREKRNEA